MAEESRELWLEHLERVLALSERREQELGAADREEIARELGISDQDLAVARVVAVDHLTRGRGFAEEGLWDSAIEELRHALALDPARDDTVIALADAYARRYAEAGDDADADEARRLARFVLQRDPRHPPAFALLKRLHVRVRDRGATRRRLGIGLAAAVALLAGGGALVIMGSSDDPASTRASAPVPPAPAVAPVPPTPPVPPVGPEAAGRPRIEPLDDGGCPPRMELKPGEGCVAPPVLVTAGVGVAGLVVGESTPEDVFATYGEDAKVSRHGDDEIFNISYDYDETGEYDAARTANVTRPAQFSFRDGKLAKITVGNYNRALITAEGIDTNNSTLDDMLAAYGEHYQLDHGDVLDTYRYENHGIELYVNRESGHVTALFIVRRAG